MDERTKEIRRILTGFITYEMGGAVITAAKNLFEVQADHIFSGSDAVRVFGLRTETRQYMIAGKVQAVHEKCIQAFSNLGRRLYLKTAPEALAMLCFPFGRNPLVVTLEAKENQLLLSVYTAKAVFSNRNIRKIIERVEGALRGELTQTDVTMAAQQGTAKGKKEKKEKKEKQPKQTRVNVQQKTAKEKAKKGGKRLAKK